MQTSNISVRLLSTRVASPIASIPASTNHSSKGQRSGPRLRGSRSRVTAVSMQAALATADCAHVKNSGCSKRGAGLVGRSPSASFTARWDPDAHPHGLLA